MPVYICLSLFVSVKDVIFFYYFGQYIGKSIPSLSLHLVEMALDPNPDPDLAK
jgi:hypothetical protein